MGFLMFNKAENFEPKNNPVECCEVFLWPMVWFFLKNWTFFNIFFRLVGWVRVRLEFPGTKHTTLPDM